MNQSAQIEQARRVLSELHDPEIPVISLEEMGILREVRAVADGLEVVITPTYSGCPAMAQIEEDVKNSLKSHGIKAKVVVQLSPSWSTDWMNPVAKQKLIAYGIAPPNPCGMESAPGLKAVNLLRLVSKAFDPSIVQCPQCGSEKTTEISAFGSTACKALYKCLDCWEPFDYFKPH